MERGLVRGWWKLPVLSGALVGLGYFPWPLLPLNLAGFIPLLDWLESNPRARGLERLKAGLLFGWTVHLIAQHWQYSLLTHSKLAFLLYLLMSFAFGLRIAVSVVLAGWLRHRTRLSYAILLPICWLPFEWLQTWGDLRMTGEHLAHTVAGYPFLVQFADLVGPFGVGAFLLVVNGLLFEATFFLRQPAGRRAAAALAILAVAVLSYDGWAWTRHEAVDGTLRVGLVQPNVALEVKHGEATAAEQWEKLERLTAKAAAQGAKLIIWPESARPQALYHWLDQPQSYAMPEVQALARRLGAAVLAGVEYVRVREPRDYDLYNAAVAVDAQGNMLPQWGAKVYLVPFVEGVPFESLFGRFVEGRNGGEWRWVSGGFKAGQRSALVEVGGARIGVLVCYEELFYDLARELRNAGAELQVVITNDAWFGASLFQRYQANALRLRAIENRSEFVRVANTGISGFVDSRGRYRQRTPLFEEAVEVSDVKRTNQRTVYNRLGDVVAWLAVAGLGAAILAAIRGRPSPRCT